MKPKLAIYGDSYTREASFPRDKPREEKIKEVWSYNKILTDEYDITNYGIPGSDFMYSFDKFENTHCNYDKVIFIVTSPYRHHFYIDDTIYFISSFDSIDYGIRIRYDDMDKNAVKYEEIATSLKNHYIYTLSDHLYAAGQAKLVEKMQKVRPDIIVVYAFNNRCIEESNFFLADITAMENKVFDVNLRDNFDGRPAHMTIENNIILAEYIKQRLDGKDVKISIDDFKKPHPIEQLTYFEKIK
jgi:hypothetical protein